MNIRLATPADRPALQAFIDTHLRRDFFMPHDLLRHVLEDGYHRTTVTEISGQLVALAVVTRKPNRLVNLLVHPDHRGSGIGTALLRHVDPDVVRAKVNMSTGDPTPFYARFGYTPTDRVNAKGTTRDLVHPRLFPLTNTSRTLPA